MNSLSNPSEKAGSLVLAVRWARAAWGSSWKLSFSSDSSCLCCLLFLVPSSRILRLEGSPDRVLDEILETVNVESRINQFKTF